MEFYIPLIAYFNPSIGGAQFCKTVERFASIASGRGTGFIVIELSGRKWEALSIGAVEL